MHRKRKLLLYDGRKKGEQAVDLSDGLPGLHISSCTNLLVQLQQREAAMFSFWSLIRDQLKDRWMEVPVPLIKVRSWAHRQQNSLGRVTSGFLGWLLCLCIKCLQSFRVALFHRSSRATSNASFCLQAFKQSPDQSEQTLGFRRRGLKETGAFEAEIMKHVRVF